MEFIMLLVAFGLFCVAAYLFIYFVVKRDRGHREPLSGLMAAVGFGLLALFFAGDLNNLLLPEGMIDIEGADSMLSPGVLLAGSLTVGIIEETLKCIPLALFLYKKRYFDELTDGIIYFGITALVFGIVEHVTYAVTYGAGVGIYRIIIAPYLHIGFTVLFGLALAYRKVLRRSWWIVVGGYVAAVVSHGVYDFFVFSGSSLGGLMVLLVSITLNVLVFVFFLRAQKRDESLGLSVIGVNKFCRQCGRPNPKQLLYCAYCGKHA